jgi:hypothetical protein
MSVLSQLDLDVRLQLAGQGYSDILSKYIDGLRFGKKNVNTLRKLILLDNYISILLDYQIASCGEDTPINCVTETEAQDICEKISKIINISFQPIGYKYIGSESYRGIGSMQIECNFIVS